MPATAAKAEVTELGLKQLLTLVWLIEQMASLPTRLMELGLLDQRQLEARS